jgi:hypothetical protein
MLELITGAPIIHPESLAKIWSRMRKSEGATLLPWDLIIYAWAVKLRAIPPVSDINSLIALHNENQKPGKITSRLEKKIFLILLSRHRIKNFNTWKDSWRSMTELSPKSRLTPNGVLTVRLRWRTRRTSRSPGVSALMLGSGIVSLGQGILAIGGVITASGFLATAFIDRRAEERIVTAGLLGLLAGAGVTLLGFLVTSGGLIALISGPESPAKPPRWKH